MPDVVVAGHICLDLIPEFKGEFKLEPNQLTSLGKMTFASGGCVANVGLALNKLGINTALMGKVGDDLFAQTLIQILENESPHSTKSIICSKADSTSYTIVISPPDFDRHFLHHEGANNSFGVEDIDLEKVKEAKLFYFGYPPLMQNIYRDGGVGFANLLKRIKDLGLSTTMDLSYPDPNGPAGNVDWQNFLKLVLPYVDIFIPSLDEILYMFGLKHEVSESSNSPPGSIVTDTAQRLLDMGVAVAGIKLGSDGIYFKTADSNRIINMGKAKPNDVENWAKRSIWSPVFEVELKVAVGAGDSSYAGFLAALLRGMNIEDATTMACAVGACSVEENDAVSGIRSWDATLERVKSGWVRATSPDVAYRSS